MYELIMPGKPIMMDLKLVQFGFEKYDGINDVKNNIREYYLIHFLVSGSGHFIIDKRKYDLKSGDVFLIPPGKIVDYYCEKFEYYWVGFKGLDVKEILSLTEFENKPVVSIEKFSKAIEIVKEMILYKKNTFRENILKMKLLYELLELFCVKDGHVINDEPINDKQIFDLAVEYIEKNIAFVNVNILSKALNMSRSGVYHIFKKNANISPKKYIINHRLNVALKMVENTNTKFTDIAAMCGFYDNNTFTKEFKKKYKRTPSEVRKAPILTDNK